MKVIDVYKQYFNGKCIYNDVPRKGAVVALTATSDAGMIKYEVSVNFFPYRDPEDFAISYDAYVSEVIFEAKGRRSKKREKVFLEEIKGYASKLATKMGGEIDFEKPLRDAMYG